MTEVLEGEVIETSRDVKVRVAALRDLEVAQQMTAVTVMLSDSRTRLLAAIAAQDLPGIVEAKARASTLQEITKQLRLGKDMQMDAAEFVRRAERGLGVAIREGQRNGTVARRGDIGGGRSTPVPDLVKPSELASKSELHGRGDEPATGIYGMTDGVSDKAFEEALKDARVEENLSRTNVARKAHAKADIPAPQTEPPRKARKTAAARKVMDDITITMNSLVFVINDTDPAEVDLGNHKSDIESIFQGMARIKKFLNAVKEQGDGES